MAEALLKTGNEGAPVASRRILVTGISTYWGGRLAQALERDPDIETIIGVDSKDPTRELERTEFVRVGTQHSLLRRLVEAAEIDTVVDTRLIVNSLTASARAAHENNVIGTMNILAACDGPSAPVRKLIFKSSAYYYGAEQDDPAFFTEAMRRPHAPATGIERDIVEAEASVADFAAKHPDTSVTTLRFANVLGPDVETSHTKLLSLPVVPMILGFDPRYQFIHEDDVVSVLEHVVRHDLPGTYNGAADGVLAFTEVCSLLGKTYAPVLPPWGTGLVLPLLARMGVRVPPEMLSQLRYGRGLDNRKLKATGFVYAYTSREAVLKLREHLRLNPVLRGIREPYRYEREVEEFLRWSPSVRNSGLGSGAKLTPNQLAAMQKMLFAAYAESRIPEADDDLEIPRRASAEQRPAPRRTRRSPRSPAGGANGQPATAAPVERYEDLKATEVISLVPSLERADLESLRRHEIATRARKRVLAAIDSALARRGAGRSE